MKFIESKLKSLENGLQKHNVEVGEIKRQINNIQNKNGNGRDEETQIHQNDDAELDKREMQNEAVIRAAVTFRGENQKQCSFRTDIKPLVDVQVCTVFVLKSSSALQSFYSADAGHLQ